MKFDSAVALVKKAFPIADVTAETKERQTIDGRPWTERKCCAILPDAPGRLHALSFDEQDGDASGTYLRPCDMADDLASDYWAGTFYDTVPAALSRLLERDRSGSVEIDGKKVTVSAGIRPTGAGLTPVGWITLKVERDYRVLEYKNRKALRDARSLAMIGAFLTDGAPEPLIDFTLGLDEQEPAPKPAPVRKPASGPILTVALRCGVVAYAKKTKYGISAVAYGNRKQAENRVADLGAGWQLWQGRGHAIYAVRTDSLKA